MANKIYVETTGELIVEDTTIGTKRGYPAFSEIKRGQNGDVITIQPVATDKMIAHIEDASTWQNKAGASYADGDALWTALDTYFDDVV